MRIVIFLFQRIKNLFHLFQAIFANFYFGFPSKKIKVIGITGTDGKTTTCAFIYFLLKKWGKKVSMINTIEARVGNRIYETGLHTTTPSSFVIQKLISQAVQQKDEYFVLEVTSHGLDQNRVWGIDFDIGVLTNITHEHLDYHLTYNHYLKTKVKLLERSKVAFINRDDSSFNLVESILENRKKIFQRPKIISYGKNDQIFSKLASFQFFNRYNLTAGYWVFKYLGGKDNDFLRWVNDFKLPKGRFQLVWKKNFKIIIDFAHTPNGFKCLLPEIRRHFLDGGRLIHIFGAAGKRDFTKRKIMGNIAGQYDDLVILTEEDYRNEDPWVICHEISSGLEEQGFQRADLINSAEKQKSYTIVLDRQEAINLALKIAKKGDVILLTGKAHEKSLCRGNVEYPWDEFKAVRKALKNINKKK